MTEPSSWVKRTKRASSMPISSAAIDGHRTRSKRDMVGEFDGVGPCGDGPDLGNRLVCVSTGTRWVQLVELFVQVGSGEAVVERVEDVVGGLAGCVEPGELDAEDGCLEGGPGCSDGGERAGSSMVARPAASTTPVRNPIEERCPSRCPDAHHESQAAAAVPVWSGWATMLGLHNAAPSMAYSLVNAAPSNNIRASESALSGSDDQRVRGRAGGRCHQGRGDARQAGDDVVQRRAHVVVVQGQDARQHRSRSGSSRSKPSRPGTKSRVMTRDGSAASRWGLRCDEHGLHGSHCGTVEKR